MKLEQSFEIAAPLDQVWRALIDVERVAPCLPGASVTGRNEDGSYAGAMTIKIGPTTASYAGRLEMEQIDESSHSATMQAQGTDKRGQGGAKATISSTLSSIDGGSTRVEVITDYHITGRLARFGRGGMIEDISERLLRDFAQCLQSTLAGRPGDGTPDAAQATPEAPSESEQPAAATEPQAEAPAAAAEAPPETKPADAEAPPTPAEPLNAIPLVVAVVRDRVRDNPAPLLALVVGFLLAVVLLRRRGRG